jgi:hypothetical protein
MVGRAGTARSASFLYARQFASRPNDRSLAENTGPSLFEKKVRAFVDAVITARKNHSTA